jgi:hypothetical protein
MRINTGPFLIGRLQQVKSGLDCAGYRHFSCPATLYETRSALPFERGIPEAMHNVSRFFQHCDFYRSTDPWNYPAAIAEMNA